MLKRLDYESQALDGNTLGLFAPLSSSFVRIECAQNDRFSLVCCWMHVIEHALP